MFNAPDNNLLKEAVSKLNCADGRVFGENFHIQGISIYSGQDEYETSKIMHVDKRMNVSFSGETVRVPNRARALSGIVVYLASEHGDKAAVTLMFHKGDVRVGSVKMGRIDMEGNEYEELMK